MRSLYECNYEDIYDILLNLGQLSVIKCNLLPKICLLCIVVNVCRILNNCHPNLMHCLILLSFVEAYYRFPSRVRRGRSRMGGANRETYRQGTTG